MIFLSRAFISARSPRHAGARRPADTQGCAPGGSLIRCCTIDLRPLCPAKAAADLHPACGRRAGRARSSRRDLLRIVDAVPTDELRHGLTRQVHVRLREHEHHMLAHDRHPLDSDFSFERFSVVPALGEEVRRLRRRRGCARSREVFAGVAETDDQEVGRLPAPLGAAAADGWVSLRRCRRFSADPAAPSAALGASSPSSPSAASSSMKHQRGLGGDERRLGVERRGDARRQREIVHRGSRRR